MGYQQPSSSQVQPSSPDLSQAESYPADPEDACDLIMKGGISSGVIYPRAACALATRYRFASVGGTSAGAIAAAAVAAAEHGRSRGGFVKLAALPDELGDSLAELFQPSATTKRAFDVLSTWLELPSDDRSAGQQKSAPDRESASGSAPVPGAVANSLRRPWSSRPMKVGRTIVSIAVGERWWFGATLLLLLAAIPLIVLTLAGGLGGISTLGWVVIASAWTPCAFAIATIVAALAFTKATLTSMAANGYGLCDGHTRPKKAPEPLTDWMQRTFDDLAGRPTVHEPKAGQYVPLTFGDLWGREAVEKQKEIAIRDASQDPLKRVDLLERIAARRLRTVDLVVMTTNLTFQRPFRFPFADDSFFFCEGCLRKYFDQSIISHLVKNGEVVQGHITARITQTRSCVTCLSRGTCRWSWRRESPLAFPV
jgi:hypothetical protein